MSVSKEMCHGQRKSNLHCSLEVAYLPLTGPATLASLCREDKAGQVWFDLWNATRLRYMFEGSVLDQSDKVRKVVVLSVL